MKINAITVTNRPPIKELKVEGLSNIVVFAGPNGVGKTRLIQALLSAFREPTGSPGVSLTLSATCEQEKQLWGGEVLNTASRDHGAKLSAILRRQKKRGKWRSSVIHFDSARQFQKVGVPQWSWEFTDPAKENISWDLLFNPFLTRYQDTVHALYRMLAYYRAEISKKYLELQQAGEKHMPIDPFDPLEKFKQVFSLLLAPKTLADIDIRAPQLRYVLDGKVLSIESLSSGEKEAFSIAFDLLLRAPEDCIIFIDEPELHLHPELAFRLLKTLQAIGERNQFMLCTHSSDLISASIENSVVFITAEVRDGSQGIVLRFGDESVTALKELGQSLGVISLGRKIVLIEGAERSIDRDAIGAIVQGRFPSLVLAPSGSRQTILSFAKLIQEVLDKTIWGVEFFMLADRDNSLPQKELERLERESMRRLRFLPRYHIENYFLDESTIAEAFRDLVPDDSWLRHPVQIRERLINIARECVPLAVNLWLSTQLRTLVGEVDVSLTDIVGKEQDAFIAQLIPKVGAEEQRLRQHLDNRGIEELARKKWVELENLLNGADDDWKYHFPGKILMNRFGSEAQTNKGYFRSLYIAAARRSDMACFQEIIDILASFEAPAAEAKA